MMKPEGEAKQSMESQTSASKSEPYEQSSSGTEENFISENESMNTEENDSALIGKEKKHKIVSYSSKKKCYETLSKENLQRLKAIYSKNVYPTKEEFKNIARELGFNLLKIENWFKHRRRTQIQKGQLDIRKKRMFSPEENLILKKAFANLKKVPLQKYQEMLIQKPTGSKRTLRRTKRGEKSAENPVQEKSESSVLSESKEREDEDQIFLPAEDKEEDRNAPPASKTESCEPLRSAAIKKTGKKSEEEPAEEEQSDNGGTSERGDMNTAHPLTRKKKYKKAQKQSLVSTKMSLRNREKLANRLSKIPNSFNQRGKSNLKLKSAEIQSELSQKKPPVNAESTDQTSKSLNEHPNSDMNEESCKPDSQNLNKADFPSEELPGQLTKIMQKIKDQEEVIFSQNMKIKELINVLNDLNQQNRSLKEHYYMINQHLANQEAIKYFYPPFNPSQGQMNLFTGQHNLGFKFL